jgi:DNA gyrase subunit A
VQGRGGLGIIAMDTSERNGELVRLCLVRPDDQLMCITDAGVVIRTRVNEIRETGRNTQGVRVIRLGESERVVDVEPIARDENEPDAGDDEGGENPPAALADAPEEPSDGGESGSESSES